MRLGLRLGERWGVGVGPGAKEDAVILAGADRVGLVRAAAGGVHSMRGFGQNAASGSLWSLSLRLGAQGGDRAHGRGVAVAEVVKGD